MSIHRLLAPLTLASVVGTTVHAADGAGQFSVRGIGGQTCAVWADILDGQDQNQRREGIMAFQSWIAGYLSAVNRNTPDTYDAMPFIDMVNVMAIVVTECRANPSELAESTIYRVVTAFSPSRVQTESPLVTVTDDGVQKVYRQETVMLVQQRLIDRGLLNGAADGMPGAATADALRAYQTQVGLPSTGEMTVDTVFQLLLN